jgi:hypothetical protein
MTTDSPRTRKDPGPSIHVVRARKLLFGGLAGGLAAALICLIIFSITGGAQGLRSAALGAGMVLFFYVVGQLVMVAFADAGARNLMAVSMASYTGRVVVLGLVLLIFEKHRDAWQAIDANTIFITTVAVIVGWLVVEVLVFRRLRIGIYDTEYEGPGSPDETDQTEAEAGAETDGDAADRTDPHSSGERDEDPRGGGSGSVAPAPREDGA